MSLFAYIKEHLSIVDVVAESVHLKPAGNYLKGPCPFHAEKDASFTVSPDKGIFYCFGCHVSGDVIGFVARKENLPQIEAAQLLIERYNLVIPANITHAHGSTLTSQQRDERERYFLLCKTVSEWMQATLHADKSALAYLDSRSVNAATINLFGIGYFGSGIAVVNKFIKDMKNESFLIQDLLSYGILIEAHPGFFSPFEERIIFPIKNALGKHCGFGGRIFKPGDQRPKYYNSKESHGFEKGKLLFGLDLAKKALQERQHCFLVEGYMDCIAMAQHGYPNTVATLGTACTMEHLKMLARLVHTIYVLYDGDAAGQKAVVRLSELCWQVNVELKVITLPAAHDPASLLAAEEPIEPFIAQAQDIFTFFIASSGTGFTQKPLALKLAAAEKIAHILARVQDPFKQGILIQQAAQITMLPMDSLKDLIERANRTTSDNSFQAETTPAQPVGPQSDNYPLPQHSEHNVLEEKIFAAIMNSLNTKAIIHIPSDLYPYFSASARAVYDKVMHNTDQINDIALFLETLDQPLRQWAVQALMHHDGQQCQDAIKHIIARLYKLHWQRVVKVSKEEILRAQRTGDQHKVQELLTHFGQLKLEILQGRGKTNEE
ncbi:MAG: DNA primase [Candidatus Babeliales bacterium]|jgi:DNA primase